MKVSRSGRRSMRSGACDGSPIRHGTCIECIRSVGSPSGNRSATLCVIILLGSLGVGVLCGSVARMGDLWPQQKLQSARHCEHADGHLHTPTAVLLGTCSILFVTNSRRRCAKEARPPVFRSKTPNPTYLSWSSSGFVALGKSFLLDRTAAATLAGDAEMPPAIANHSQWAGP